MPLLSATFNTGCSTSIRDRKKPVHQGNTLPARLIRLMTSAMVPQTREAVCELFFVLCHEDGKKKNKNVNSEPTDFLIFCLKISE